MFGQGKSFDMLICEKMNFRPAEKWITRNRNWPDSKDIHIMKAQGCHIVPKPTSSRDETSWRLSFSRQEVYLSSLVPMPARYSYMALKLIFKKFWKSKCRGLKSYHVKHGSTGLWSQKKKSIGIKKIQCIKFSNCLSFSMKNSAKEHANTFSFQKSIS